MSVMNALFVFSLLAVIELGMSLFGMEDEVQTATSFGSHSDHEAFLEAFSKKLLEQELAQASDEDNVLISPFSIAKLLSMLLVAAVYDRQIENALQGQSSDLLKSFSELLSQLNGSESNVGLSVVGEIVLSNEFHVLENFTDTLWKFYHSGVNRVNFTSQAEAIRNNINDMVLYKTNLKLPNLLGEGAITSDMKIALLDVAYIEGQWRIPFDVLRTTKEAFYDLDGSKSMVDTMHAKLKIRYNEGYSNGGYTYYIDLPYVNEQFSMGIAVPRDVTWLKALERELLDYGMSVFFEPMQDVYATLHVPKFQFDKSTDMKAFLPKVGISSLFQWETFPGMTNRTGVQGVSAIFSRTVFKFNEGGSREAALNGAGNLSSIESEIDITVDRPFVFVVQCHNPKAILFVGSVRKLGEKPLTTVSPILF